MPMLPDEEIGKKLWQRAKAQAIAAAEIAGPGPGLQKYTPDDEVRMFREEAEGWTLEKELALLAEGKSREEVGDLKYPARQKMAKTGGRAFSPLAQHKWLAETAKKAYPEWSLPANPAAGPPGLPTAPPATFPTPTTQTTDTATEAGPFGEEVYP